jgi:hypothetical protein
VQSLENECFRNCISLKEVDFGENSQLTHINREAFAYCCSLEFISFPSRLEYLGERCFRNCENLKFMGFLIKKESIIFHNSCFEDCTGSKIINFSFGSFVADCLNTVGANNNARNFRNFFSHLNLESIFIPTYMQFILEENKNDVAVELRIMQDSAINQLSDNRELADLFAPLIPKENLAMSPKERQLYTRIHND